MNYAEKRASERIHVEVPVHIGREESVTRDVSQAGIYFLTEHLFAEGVVFDFSLDLAYVQPGTLVLDDVQSNHEAALAKLAVSYRSRDPQA